jgi:hypothetical protein
VSYRECRGAENPGETQERSGRGTFDRGDLKEVGERRSLMELEPISLCNEEVAGGFFGPFAREPPHCIGLPLEPEDIPPAVAVAVGHFVQVGQGPVIQGGRQYAEAQCLTET